MGGSSSRQKPNGNCTVRSFKVFILDQKGQQINPGTIEVTTNDLILYQRGKDAVKWPLFGLRRYGFDKELFTFECGRRCPTGEGIFAFKCRRAEALFNLLQECILRSNGSRPCERRHSFAAATVDQVNMVQSRSRRSVGDLGTVHGVQLYENNYLARFLESNNIMFGDAHNSDCIPTSSDQGIQYAELDLSPVDEHQYARNGDDLVIGQENRVPYSKTITSVSGHRATYVNVPTNGEMFLCKDSIMSDARRSLALDVNILHQYQNVGVCLPERTISRRRSTVGSSVSTDSGVSSTTSTFLTNMQYGQSSAAYAAIDFNRTQALNVDRAAEGVRRFDRRSIISLQKR